ncbi:MAG: hypothetical protein OJF51_000573 [Nitrospira sp.]|jgi:hypothetical protein|nr:MAG: hypothetical protein OJF51_000573 [Nitrospira sp.]
MSGQDKEPCLPRNEQAGPVESLKRHNRFHGFEIVIAMEKHRSYGIKVWASSAGLMQCSGWEVEKR